MTPPPGTSGPSRPHFIAWGVAVAVVLLILSGLIMLVASRRPPGSSFWVWTYTTVTVNTRPDLAWRRKKFVVGVSTIQEVGSELGKPDREQEDGPVRIWHYEHRYEQRTERLFLGAIRVGSGTSSQGSGAMFGFENGVWVFPSEAARPPASTLVGLRRISRLLASSSHPGALLPSRKPVWTQLAAIKIGVTTADDAVRLMGTPDMIRVNGSCEYWHYRTVHELPGPNGIEKIPGDCVLLVDGGIIVDTPVSVCDDEEMLRRFEGMSDWPAK